ncbi:MAG: exodeoxyribonuclease VII large subunit [Patescibacteria group bacterium]
MSDLFLQTISDKKNQSVSNQNIDDFLNPKLKAKELLPQINWIFTHKKTEYLEQLLELRNHSSVQIRRKVAQGIAFLATKDNLDDLQKWQLAESDRETWLILESTLDKIQRKQTGTNLEQSVKILSVTEALNLVKRLVGEQEYTLEGEISEVRAVRQMYIFSVKDKQDSRLDCWVFGGVVIRSGFPLNEGLAVRITGKFKMSVKNSRIYFDVHKLQLSGEGELLRNLKLLESKLRSEGIFDETRKRLVSKLPRSVLLLASTISAALSDYIKVLGQRRGGIKIYHLAIKTQGVGAEAEILESLALTNKLTEKYNIDTVVLTRGGGSQDDLVVFNSEKVVRAVHGINRPTIVAIGHERDTTLVELAADLRASTPSQAAELSSMSALDVEQKLENYRSYFDSYFFARKQDYTRVASNIQTVILSLVQRHVQSTKLVTERTGNTVTSFIGKTKVETQRLWQNSLTLVKINLNQNIYQLKSIKQFEPIVIDTIKNLSTQTDAQYQQSLKNISDRLENSKNNFSLIASKISLHNPENILKKGYALIKQEGKVREKIADLQKGSITIQLQDGEKTV